MSFFNQSPGPAQGTSQQPYNNQQQGFNNNQGSQYIWQSTSQQPQYGQQQGGGFNQSQGTWQMNGMQYGQQMQQQQPWQGNMSNGPSPFGSSMFGQQPGPGLSNSASEKKNYLPGYLSSVGTTQNASPQQASGSRPAFGSPAQQRENSGADDSMDRDRSSPPVGRGSVFGSASKKATIGRRNQNTTIFGAPSRATQDDDAPPIDSLHDMDDDLSPAHTAASNTVAVQESSDVISQTTEVAGQSHGIVIFGFQPDQLASILDHFRNIGQISKIEPSSSNWATIYYTQPGIAARAVRKNGDVVNGTMVGVKWLNGREPELPPTPSTQSQQVAQQSNGIGTPVPIHSGDIRKTATPVGWFGRPAASGQSTPVKNDNPFTASTAQGDRSGMFSRVSDLVFGF